MGKSLSLDIRERVVALVDEGLSCHEAAPHLRIKQQTGGIKAAALGRARRSKLDQVSDWRMTRIDAEGDISMRELAEALKIEHNLIAPPDPSPWVHI